MRVLAVTNSFPTKQRPVSGPFVLQQIKGLEQIGMGVEVMHVDRDSKGPLVYYGLTEKVARRAASFRADIIHVMYGGIMARAVAALSDRIPVIVSICGSDILGTAGRSLFSRIQSRISIAASVKACAMASGIVVKSRNLARALPAFINRGKVRVIPNGVDLGVFRPMDREVCRRNLGWAKDSFHVLFPLSGYEVTKRLPLAEESVRLARASGLPVTFHQLKGIPHEQVPTWLNASDVLLFTSYQEGSPNIIKEGLACNVPIVSVDVGDVAERINGIEGCHIVPANPLLIAAKLKEVADRGLRIEGRTSVSHLSLCAVAESLRTFYESVIHCNVPLENAGALTETSP